MTSTSTLPRLGRRRLTALITALATAVGSVAVADPAAADVLADDLDTTIDNTLESLAVTAGGSATVGFFVRANNDTGAPGCNLGTAGDGRYIDVSFQSMIPGITATPFSIDVCDDPATTVVEGLTTSTVSAAANKPPGGYTIGASQFHIVESPGTPGLVDSFNADFLVRVSLPTDSTPPVIDSLVTGELGAGGWYVGPVTVAWTVTDGGSAVVVDAGCGIQVYASETAAGTSSCTAHSLGGSSSAAVPFRIDLEDPSALVELSGQRGAGGWYVGPVTATTTGSDTLGTVTCSAAQVFDADGADLVAAGSCSDAAGRTTSASTVPFDLDATPPEGISFVGIEDGATFSVGALPTAPTCTATDHVSSMAGCTVDGWTSAVGTHTLTATAIDVAGNSSTAMLSYSVEAAPATTINGFYAPVRMDMPGQRVVNTVQGGSTVPLKFEVFQGAVEVTSTSIVQSIALTETGCAGDGVPIGPLVPVDLSTMRWDSDAGRFMVNWRTPRSAKRCYDLRLATTDGTTVTAHFAIR